MEDNIEALWKNLSLSPHRSKGRLSLNMNGLKRLWKQVQIHGLPLGMMNVWVGTILGEPLGDVEEVDSMGELPIWGRLLDFCFVCGKLDHLENNCGATIRWRNKGKWVHRDYGSWLRAELNKNSSSISSGNMAYRPLIMGGRLRYLRDVTTGQEVRLFQSVPLPIKFSHL
ncbi:hypothetical protein REPUB_Repub09cG0096100 [Reevesia pubescens]